MPREAVALKPIIKWPGGKSREFGRIREFLPPSSTWVEPFMGGGAFFFRLEPRSALLNDASLDLIDFYRAVREGDAELRQELEAMSLDRQELAARARRRAPAFSELTAGARRGEGDEAGAAGLAEGSGDTPLRIPAEGVRDCLARSISSKVRRLLGLERKHGKVFGGDELPAHFETALQAGYYTAVRDLYRPRSSSGGAARFFFLRELCYGSMFRYGKDGRFNIPYGGISYNRVDLAAKVARLFGPEVRSLLARGEIFHGDFGAFLEKVSDRLGPGAFVFLDPPYDTEFSNYANLGFGKSDHARLAEAFSRLDCPALVVIQRTDFILELYEKVGRKREKLGLPFFLTSYGKTYGYNVRGRNVREATHLLVLNYEPATRTSVGDSPTSR